MKLISNDPIYFLLGLGMGIYYINLDNNTDFVEEKYNSQLKNANCKVKMRL